MQKKIPVKTLYLLLVISIGLIGLGVGSTFAMFTATAEINNPIIISSDLAYSNDIVETVDVNIPAGQIKTITLNITNNTSSSLNYTTWYIDSNNVDIGKETESSPSTIGTLNNGASISIKVLIKNREGSPINILVGVSSSESSVVLGNNMKVVPNRKMTLKASETISNLFSKTGTVTSNSLSHNIDTNHQLIKDADGNIRYYGQNPNNYIDIGDNDLWRIIGVFDDKLKLIRANSIGSYSWDTSASTVNSGNGINEWSQADLMKLLNNNYIGTGGSLWYNRSSGTCYNGQSNTTTSCDFTSTGLSQSVKNENKIADVTWNTGGWNSWTVYPNSMYGYERGTTVYTGTEDGITRTTSWTGKIGLAYPSDYGYATDLQECNQNLYNYSNAGTNNRYPCRGNNWMWYAMTGASIATSTSGARIAWLLTPYSSNAYAAWNVYMNGSVYGYDRVHNSYAVSPVLYLNSEQVIESGSGSIDDVYRLSDINGNNSRTYYLLEVKKSVDNGTATSELKIYVPKNKSYGATIIGGNYYTIDSVSCTNGQNASVSESHNANGLTNANLSITISNNTVCTIKMSS